MTSVLLAVPTIPERFPRREGLEKLWRERTPEADLEIVYSEAGTTWGDGLNDIVEQLGGDVPDVFVCGSDDFCPADERWLPSVLPWLEQNIYPAPLVEDPRFRNYGGHPHPVPDGTPGDMSTFPILRGDWLDIVFPLPEGLHYYSDNFLAALLSLSGVSCVAVPSCRMLHLHAQEGRGAGYGSENTRLFVDTVRYTDALNERGIDRLSLPPNIRGHMFEEHYHEIGRLIIKGAAA